MAHRLAAAINMMNVGNTLYQLDSSNTFGASHTGEPLMVYG